MFLVESSYFTYDWMLNLLSHQIKNGFAKKKRKEKKIYTIQIVLLLFHTINTCSLYSFFHSQKISEKVSESNKKNK